MERRRRCITVAADVPQCAQGGPVTGRDSMQRVRWAGWVLTIGAAAVTPGCAVIGAATTVGSLAVSAVSTAADVAIGVGRVTTRVVGAGVDALTPGSAAPPLAAAAPASSSAAGPALKK